MLEKLIKNTHIGRRSRMNIISDTNQYIISNVPTKDQMRIVKVGLEDYNKKFPFGELDIPTPDISLVLRDKQNRIVGGVITSMLTGIMHLERLWIEEKCRGKGLGKQLVLAAEKIGRTKGYPASQTWTYSFQAPEFYQNIGYDIIGIFTGYTEGITEYVLLKKFGENPETADEERDQTKQGFTISEDVSETSMHVINEGLRKHNKKHVGEIRNRHPGIEIELVLKIAENEIIGGLMAYTTLKTVHIVHLWIHEDHRNQGHGKELLETAEAIAKENGCISGLLNVLSFQSPGFFEKQGYEPFGISDGYPDSIEEYFFIKKFS